MEGSGQILEIPQKLILNPFGYIDIKVEVRKWEENGNVGVEEILIFFHVVWLGEIKKIICLVDKKSERIKNVICVNMLLCSYFIIYKK